MSYPTELKYTEDHEWVSPAVDGICTIGVTSFAIEQLTDIVHIEFPDVGDEFAAGDSIGTIESTKTVSDLYLPIAGKIVATNEDLLEKCDTFQESPHDKAWIVKVSMSSDNLGDLMDAAAYKKFTEES